MSSRDVATLQGIFGGIDKAVTNFQNIKAARQKLDEDKRVTDIGLKIKDLELKKLENSLSPEQISAEREKLKAETQAKKSAYTLSNLKAQNAETKSRRELESHKSNLSFLDAYMQGKRTMPPGTTYKTDDFTISNRRANDDDALTFGDAAPAEPEKTQYEIGQVIPTATGTYTVVGFDEDGEALVETPK